jgi:iron complex outermembrane recepter protein
VDVLLFVTNAFDREYTSLVTGSWNTFGLETGRNGIPRMYGARLRYSF